MLAMRSYFNFPAPCTNWGWLARRTQHWAGVSILGYKNTSSPFSSHFFQSLTFITNLCKVFRKQSCSDSQTESLELCGMSCTVKPPVHYHKSHLAHRLLHCCVSLTPWDKTQKGSWAILAPAGSLPVLSDQESVLQPIIFWPRL